MAAAETHTSVLLLTSDRVWKIKKAVRFAFLDFTTVEARRLACEREVALNRRMAPDVYLGVGRLVAPDGRPDEPAVVMLRLPDDRRLSTLVRQGAHVDDALRALAHQLATMHESEPPLATDAAAALHDLWERNLGEARRFRGEVLDEAAYDEITLLARRFLAGRGPLLAQRVADGWVRDGHGDLQADDVFCLPDGPRALDCIEFDDALRRVDGLDDAAFLAMDLERLGAPALGAAFLGWYVEFRGDPAPASLAHHYVAYRAFVRAMVSCLRHEQGDPSAAALVRRLTEVTCRHLRRGAVRLVLVGGAPGAGKSTLASAVAGRLGWVVLRSDVVRKELAGLAPADRGPEALYSPERTAATYDALLARAEVLLGRGESVVLDATWTRSADRAAAAAVAQRTSSDLVELRCVVAPELVRERMAARTGSGDASDADLAVARRLAAAADPWPGASDVDTSGSPDAALQAALAVAAPESRGGVILEG